MFGVRIKGLKLRQNSNWTGNCSGKLRRRPGLCTPATYFYCAAGVHKAGYTSWIRSTSCTRHHHVPRRLQGRRRAPQYESFYTVPFVWLLSCRPRWVLDGRSRRFLTFFLEALFFLLSVSRQYRRYYLVEVGKVKRRFVREKPMILLIGNP